MNKIVLKWQNVNNRIKCNKPKNFHKNLFSQQDLPVF